jgi:hypothetical protein
MWEDMMGQYRERAALRGALAARTYAIWKSIYGGFQLNVWEGGCGTAPVAVATGRRRQSD